MAVFTADCPHCGSNRVAFDVMWGYQATGDYRVIISKCGGCRMPLTAAFVASGEIERIDGEIGNRYPIVGTWPAAAELAAPAHTPRSVANRFVEGDDAFRRQRWNSAVAMYRSALDIATKAMPDVPEGLTFYKRLIWLHEHNHITKQMKDWADHVRVEGNDALHDPEEYEEADARPLRLFTETFLRYVFELPGEVAAFRGETLE